LLRCYAKYLLQLGIPFSQAYMEDVLVAHSRAVRRLIRQFETQFDPTLSKGARKSELETIQQAVQRAVAKARKITSRQMMTAK